MIRELLTDSEREQLLPVLPAVFGNEKSTSLKRTYETRARMSVHDTAVSYPDGVAVNVARANLTNRIKHAQRDAAEIWRNTTMTVEYGRDFASLDQDIDSSPENRANVFLTSQYLPNFEIYARLLIGDGVAALDTNLARRALHLIASDYEDVEVVQDTPRTRVKVSRIITEYEDEDYAVIKTKTDGLRVKVDDHMIDVKERRSGVIPVGTLPFGNVRQAFTILGNIANSRGIREDDMTPFRREIVQDYLARTDAYEPIIERLYMTRPIDD